MTLSPICLCGLLLTLVSVEGTPPHRAERPADGSTAIDRFLSQRANPVASAVARRRLVATTRGGAMSGWVDACTFLDGTRMRYKILAQGGSGTVRKRALIAALDGEVKARGEGDPARAGLIPANYDFAPEDATGDVLRVALRPKRKASMLIEGSMTLTRDSGELLSVEGRLVEPPSFWTRQVHVTRRYSRIAGVRVPVSMESTAKIMVIGESTFYMSYTYLTINGKPAGEPGTIEDPRACAAPAAPPFVRYDSKPKSEWPVDVL